MTARVTDLNGFYTVPNNPLSRPGIFPYTKKSTGFPGWENDPGGVVKVYRPESELADPAVAESFKLAPWVDDHAMLGNPELDATLTPPEKKGVHGTIGEQVFYDPADKMLKGNVRVWSSSLADAIDAGKKELSCGFRCVYDFTPGEFEGERYDAIQRTIRGNHLASVPMGRMGPEVAVLDHLTFAFDADELRGLPMKTTRRKNTAKKLGIAEDALPAYFGITGADALKVFNVAMDAEEDAPEGDGAAGGGMTIEEIVDVVKEAAGPLGELNDALMTMAGAPPADAEDPDALTGDDDMEPVVDEMGNAKKNPDGSPMMQKKAAPAADKAPAIGIAAMDAAISGFDAISRTAHAALKGRAAPASLVAMDAAVTKAKAASAKAKAKKKVKPVAKVTDAAEIRAALDGVTAAVKAAPTVKSIMADIASRDKLAARVSAFTGTFDHSEMTATDVAKYALGKFGVAAMDGQEVGQVEAYLHNRPLTDNRKPASAFGMDGAPAAGKATTYVNDFISGRAPTAA